MLTRASLLFIPVGRTLPYPDLHPKRPTGSLVSKKVLTSIISQTVINALVQLGVFYLVKAQPWCVPRYPS